MYPDILDPVRCPQVLRDLCSFLLFHICADDDDNNMGLGGVENFEPFWFLTILFVGAEGDV